MALELRHLNRERVLKIIRSCDLVSRVQIAGKVNLSKTTVSAIVAELLEEGLVSEVGTGLAQPVGGRRPILLQFNNKALVAVGVEVDSRECVGVLVDLSGQPFERVTTAVVDSSVEAVIKQLESTAAQLCAGLDRDRIVGYGIALPGLINSTGTTVRLAVNLDWRDVPLRALLEPSLGDHLYVIDRGKAAALGEIWHGVGKDVDDLIYIYIGRGIGGGIVIGRSLHSGVGNLAGEIGHVTVEPAGPLCRCGNRGCLEALAAGPAIAVRTREKMRQGKETLLAQWIGDNFDAVTGKMVAEAAIKGDGLSLEIMEETGEYIGIAVAALINLLNPEVVVIGGPVSRSGGVLLKAIRAAVRRRAVSASLSGVKIVRSKLGDEAAAIGAAAAVIEQFVDSPALAAL